MTDEEFVNGLKTTLRPIIERHLKEHPFIDDDDNSPSNNLVPYAMLEICVDMMPLEKSYLSGVFNEILNYYPKQTIN